MPDELSVSHSRVNASLTISPSLLGRGQGRVRLQGWSFQLRGTNLPSTSHRAYAHHHSSTADASTATEDLCAVTLYAMDTPSISGSIRSSDNAGNRVVPKDEKI